MSESEFSQSSGSEGSYTEEEDDSPKVRPRRGAKDTNTTGGGMMSYEDYVASQKNKSGDYALAYELKKWRKSANEGGTKKRTGKGKGTSKKSTEKGKAGTKRSKRSVEDDEVSTGARKRSSKEKKPTSRKKKPATSKAKGGSDGSGDTPPVPTNPHAISNEPIRREYSIRL